MKLFKIFKIPRFLKKKELTEEEKWIKYIIKKTPRSKRTRMLALYEDAKKGIILKAGEDVNNKEKMKGHQNLDDGKTF